jgi:hypothetical protein
MFDLEDLKQHIIGKTGIPTDIGLDKLPEIRQQQIEPDFIRIQYDRVISPSESDVLLDSASEVGNDVVMLTKIVLDATDSSYPSVWLKVYAALLHFEPVQPSPAYQPRTVSFVNCDFLSDNGRTLSVFVFSYVFDRWFVQDCVCVPSL